MTGAMSESAPEHSPTRAVDPSSSPESESPPTVAEENQPGVVQQSESEVVPEDTGQVSDNGETGTEDAVGGQDGGEQGGEEEEEDEDEEEESEDAEDEEEDDDEDEEDEEDDDEEDEEPRLKYARLTQHLGGVYRNGDATSAFLVAGDKMIIGTHNGNIHIIQLPMFQSLRVYHAHAASVTSISISPYPPPLPTDRPEAAQRLAPQSGAASLRPGSRHSEASTVAATRRSREPAPIPNTPANNIYIATSSIDGHVCVQNLVDMRDVQLRNFARPVQAVAISPDYKNDRTYLSGGLAGQLILTVGGPTGKSTSTTIGTAAAAASGWLGSMGLGHNTGKDTVLHSGEGTISNIKWSLSGKYVVWLNEHGLKIMRTKLHLDTADADDAWKRLGHVDRPQTDEWDVMASVWKGRAEWIDELAVEVDDDASGHEDTLTSPAAESLKRQAASHAKQVERLIVGWGNTIWIIHVHPGGVGIGKHAGERTAGHAEIAQHLRMDCIISGISLYTQRLLLVLACPLDDDDDDDEESDEASDPNTKGQQSKSSTASASSEPAGGNRKRKNNLPPELRLVDLVSQAEVDRDDGLVVSRYERLSSGDYHLGILPAQNAASAVASSKGALESLAGFGSEVWNAAINPKLLFSSGASIRSKNSGDEESINRVPSMTSTLRTGITKTNAPAVHSNLIKPGAKIFIHSPYDCILATKRDLADHLAWLVEHQQYRKAWELLDENPDILASQADNNTSNLGELVPATPDKRQGSTDDFCDDASSVMGSVTAARQPYSTAQKEKRRIGELWIRELIEAGDWTTAGQVCGKVLGTSDRWEKWVWTFAGANKVEAIANHIPPEPMHPPLSRTIYEVVLNHYIQADKVRFKEMLERWPTELFDIKTITTALENQLKYRDVREDSVEGGEKGRDWRIVMASLAKLHEANGRYRESLKCYIKLQDADSAFRLIGENHLADAVADDIPSFIGLRVPAQGLADMTESELEEATSEAITLLVDEAQHGLVRPSVVVSQLQEKDLNLFLFFYLAALYQGQGLEELHAGEKKRERLQMESKHLVDEFADLAVRLFARYNRGLLMDFLKSSTCYAFEKAAQECERYRYDDELVYLYSKTGQMKRALFLIIDRLQDVKKAIEFAKEQDDPDLWEDLLTYSMDKPSFIRGLLEQVGTAINPITLVRRIPEGLEIEGLRDGLKHIMKEHEIQYSISSGVARVLRSEVAAAQNELRLGQRKGIKFEVAGPSPEHVHVDVETKDAPNPTTAEGEAGAGESNGDGHGDRKQKKSGGKDGRRSSREVPRGGHCAECDGPFTEMEAQTLVGFACGHIYHLAHLLERLRPGSKQEDDMGAAVADRPGHGWRVGAKVTHARLLKDKIRAGCPVCVDTRDQGQV
ncbi:hypothetical protein ACRALDRAFT_1065437 [Sodiomyces alcalophilus JCM 7366]|uniref:uncharacterized protein n=1 Tax=Sodiomyces alcalophilus JCM 7366 TaxID=591952 RepID=UPI0039B42DF4